MNGRYPHLMLDIETLGVTPDAPILSLAAVPFGAGEIAPVAACFHVVLDLQAEYAAGAEASQSTLEWWTRQSPAARQVLDRATTFGSPPVQVAAALVNYVGTHMAPGYGVWRNGASFDPVLVSEMFWRHGVPLPWKYSQIRCHRTLLALHPGVVKSRPTLAHDALADAYGQAQTAGRILAERSGEVRW